MLDLPDNYAFAEACKLVMYLHGAGGSINAAGTGEGTNLTDYLLTFGYAVLRVNGLPSGFYEEGMRIGGSFGIPVACDCHYKAYLYVVNNYNIDKNGCYIIGQSMGGVVGCNIVQNYNIPVRDIAFDAPLFSMYNAWFAPTWGQTGNDAKSVRYLLAKGFNFDFTEVNTAYNKSYTLATFPFDTAHSEYSSAMTTALWNSNKNKLNGYDPYTCNVFTIADKDYKIFKYPFKAWRGEQDSPDSRLPYCKHFVEMVNNAGGLAYARYPDVSFHGLVSATAAAGLEMITENGVTVPCVTKEIRLFLERY